MIQRVVTLPDLGLMAGTRAALGAGAALLLADRMSKESRRAVGWTLVIVGILTTFPLAAAVLIGGKLPPAAEDAKGNGKPTQAPKQVPARV